MPNLETRVRIVRGAARDVRVYLFDERDQPEDLSGYSAGQLSIAADEESAPLVDAMSTGVGVDADGAYVTVPISQADTLVLLPGTYVCDLRVTLDAKPYQTLRFYAEVSEAISQ